jgi:hypothetical protein
MKRAIMKHGLWLLAGLAWGGSLQAADPASPHPHQGSIEAFTGKPDRPDLGEEKLAALARGEAILTTTEESQGWRGVAIQDIQATPDVIWNRIAAFREYPRMVDHVEQSEPYLEDGNDLRVRFVLRVIGFRYEYYIRHDFRPDQGYMTWTLDYSRQSDLDDSVGYWVVEDLPKRPGFSRLYYSIDMRTRSWMPGFLRTMIARQGLEDATGWVKKEAEALQRQRSGNRETGPGGELG